MNQNTAKTAIRSASVGKPARAFGVLALLMLVAIIPLSYLLYQSFAVPVVVFALIAAIGLRGLMLGYPHKALGACNGLTLGRAALVSVLAGAIFAPSSQWAVFAIAVFAFALDGADGWLARRSGLTSAFGARFDMETDALLGAILTLVLMVNGPLGAAVLILGFSRYAFVLAGFIWPTLQKSLPYSFRRKAICAVQIAALIILVFPLTPNAIMVPVAVLGGAALLYSFAVDTLHLMRRSG
jgi:phosphatidylglycerophosphate synthase